MKNVWILLAVLLAVGALYVLLAPYRSDKDSEESSDYDELKACAFLTSIDSKRSLYLSPSHVARLSALGGTGTQWATGTWERLDDEKRTFKISIAGNDTAYTLISAPAGEGCMLVPGDTSRADLDKAWYSTLQDPK